MRALRLAAAALGVALLPTAQSCTAFDGSSLSAHNLLSGVGDARGIQSMLNRALGQQTHIAPAPGGIALPTAISSSHEEEAETKRRDWVYDTAELSCYDFDEECRWKNVEGLFIDEMDWYQGSGFLDQGRLQVATGTHVSPDGAYAIVATDRAQLGTAKAVLVSDVVGCQIGPGEIRFLFWTSPEVRLRVCTRRASAILPTYDFCTPAVQGGSPGPAHLAIPDGGREPFTLHIVADNFVFSAPTLQGGFAIVDNIEYYAEMCEGDERAPGPVGAAASSIIQNALLPPSSGTQNNVLSGLLGGLSATTTTHPQLVEIEELTRRGPLPPEASSSMEEDEDYRAPPPPTTTTTTRRQHRKPKTTTTIRPPLFEEVEAADTEPWESTDALLRAFRDDMRGGETVDPCRRPVKEMVQDQLLPAAFEAQLARNTIHRTSEMIDESPTIRRQQSSRDACDVLNCRFEAGECASLVRGTPFSLSDRAVGNPLTGIRGDASLLPYNRDGTFAYIKGPIEAARLSTPPFRLQEDAFFVFAYHKVDADSSLKVFAKPADVEREMLLFEAPLLTRNAARRWFREGRQLPSSEYDYIAFEVRSLPSSTYIGIDEILVLNKKRQLMCP